MFLHPCWANVPERNLFTQIRVLCLLMFARMKQSVLDGMEYVVFSLGKLVFVAQCDQWQNNKSYNYWKAIIIIIMIKKIRLHTAHPKEAYNC